MRLLSDSVSNLLIVIAVKDTRFTRFVGKRKIDLFSSVYKRSNVARIKIDGFDYAQNMRGLNIVVFNAVTGRLLDSVCFDTHAKSIPCYRDNESERLEIRSLRDEVAALSRQIADVRKDLLKAEEYRRVDSARTQLMLWHSMPETQRDEEAVKLKFFKSLPLARGTIRKQQLGQFIQLCEFDRVCAERGAKYWLCYGGLLGAVRAGRLIPWDDDVDVAMMREDWQLIRDAFDDNPDFLIRSFNIILGQSVTRCYQLGFRKPAAIGSLDIFVMDFTSIPQDEAVSAYFKENLSMRDEARVAADEQYGDYAKAPRYLADPRYHEIVDRHIEAFNRKHLLRGSHEERSAIFWGLENVAGGTARRSYFQYETVFPLGTISLEGREFSAPADPVAVVSQLYGDYLSVPDDMFSHRHLEPSPVQIRRLDEALEKHRNVIVGLTGPDGKVITA